MGRVVLWSWCPMDFVVLGQNLSVFILGCSFDHLLLASLPCCGWVPEPGLIGDPVVLWVISDNCCSWNPSALSPSCLEVGFWLQQLHERAHRNRAYSQFTFKRNDRNNVSITLFAKLPVFKYWQINQFRGKLFWFVCTIEPYICMSSASETKPAFYSVSSTFSQFTTHL